METIKKRPDRLDRWFLSLAALGVALAYAGEYAVMGDDAVFLSLARGLARGWGYASMIRPVPTPESQYPPLLPFLLYPFQRFAPASLGGPRLLVAILTVFGLFAAFRYRRTADLRARAVGGPPTPPLLLLLPCLAPMAFLYGSKVLTEGPMLLLAYLSLRWAEEERPAASAFACLGAMLLRQASWGLFLGLALVALVRGRGRHLAWLLAVVLLGCGPWWAWQWANGSAYLSTHVLVAAPVDGGAEALSLLGLFERVAHHLVRYAGRCVGEAVFFPFLAPPTGALTIFASLVPTALIAIGFVRRFLPPSEPLRPLGRFGEGMETIRRNLRAEDGYVLVTFAMLLVHPIYDARYLLPLLPTLLTYAIEGAGTARVRLSATVLGGVLLYGSLSLPFQRLGPGTRSYLEACDLVRSLPADVPVVSRKPGAVWWYGGRVGVGTPGSPDPVKLLGTLQGANTPYLLVDRLDGTPRDWERFLEPAIGGAGPQFAVVARAGSDSNVRILRWTAGP